MLFSSESLVDLKTANINADLPSALCRLTWALLSSNCFTILMHVDSVINSLSIVCIKIVKQLLERGAQVNLQRADGRSALMLAVLRSTRLSLEKSTQVNPQDNDLMLASNHLSYSLVQTVLDYGAQTDLEDNKGNTAASLTSNKRIINLLNGLTEVSIMHFTNYSTTFSISGIHTSSATATATRTRSRYSSNHPP